MTKRIPRALAGGTGLLLASSLGFGALGTTGAGAAEEPPSERTPAQVRTARLCDNTACYIAWRVVDSDRDGVSDADEIVAGTDPWDPTSTPRPEVVVELATAEKLPSFQYGVGVFVVLPIDLVELNTKQMPDLGEGAFPIETRKDSLARMGISSELLAEMGLDPTEDGLTIGLDRPSSGDGLPGRRVAGLDVRTISAGGGSDGGVMPGVQGGGVIGTSRNPDGTTTTWFSDGGKQVTRSEDGVTVVDRYGPGDTYQGSTTTTGGKVDSDVPTDVTTTVHSDGQGKVIGTTTSTTYKLPDGTTVSTVEKRTYLRDADGNITGQRVVTSTSVSNGRSGSTTGDVVICNAAGKDCSPPVPHGDSDGDHGEDSGGDHGDDSDDGDHGDDSDDGDHGDDPVHDDGDGNGDDDHGDTDETDGDHGYVNPDADLTVITVDDVDGVLRLRGAAVTTVQDWTAPGSTDELPEYDRWGGVAYVDDTGQTLTVLSEPRITTAQPEVDPNLPDPTDGAPFPPDGPTNCDGLCYQP